VIEHFNIFRFVYAHLGSNFFLQILYLGAQGPCFTKQLQERKCNRMFFLNRSAPQGPAVHHLQNSFQVVIKQTCPLELFIGDTGSGIAGGKPGKDPAVHVLIVCIPNIRQAYPWRYGLPMDRRQGKVLVQKLDEQRIWLSDHCYLARVRGKCTPRICTLFERLKCFFGGVYHLSGIRAVQKGFYLWDDLFIPGIAQKVEDVSFDRIFCPEKTIP
jgi:hypothetical protein